jgi:hypothetical protein
MIIEVEVAVNASEHVIEGDVFGLPPFSKWGPA